jgi:hypothetical protein
MIWRNHQIGPGRRTLHTLHRALALARRRAYDARKVGAKTAARIRRSSTAAAIAEQTMTTVEDDLLFIPAFLRRKPAA